MATKKKIEPVFNNYKDDAYYANAFEQNAFDNGAFDIPRSAAQTGQQAFQQSQMEANDTTGNGVLGHAIDSAQAGAASMFGGQARFLGQFSPFGGDMLNSFADSMDAIVKNNTPQEELTGANWWANAVGNAAGSGGAAMVEAAVVSGIASALGITGAVGGATAAVVGQTPKLARLKNAATALWSKGEKGGLVAKLSALEVGGSPFEGMAEAGNLITEMRNEGYTDDEIRTAALKSASYNTAWLTVANMLEGKVANRIAKNSMGTLGKIGVAGVTNALNEGVEEMGQEAIGTWAKDGFDAPLDYDRIIEAGKQGAAGGLFLGGGRQALDSLLSNKEQMDAVETESAQNSERQALQQEIQEENNAVQGEVVEGLNIRGNSDSIDDISQAEEAYGMTDNPDLVAQDGGDVEYQRRLNRQNQLATILNDIAESGEYNGKRLTEARQSALKRIVASKDYGRMIAAANGLGVTLPSGDTAQAIDGNNGSADYPASTKPNLVQQSGLAAMGKELDKIIRQAYYGSEEAVKALKAANISQDYINRRFAELEQEKNQMQANWRQKAANGEELTPSIQPEQIVEATDEQNIQQPSEVQEQVEVKPKPTYVGSAMAYKEPNHKWKQLGQAQADLDAIVEDIKANGGNYNLSDSSEFFKSLQQKLGADFGFGKHSKSKANIKAMWNKFKSDARAAKNEWKANKPTQKPTTKPANEAKPVEQVEQTLDATKTVEQPIKPTEEIKPVEPTNNIEAPTNPTEETKPTNATDNTVDLANDTNKGGNENGISDPTTPPASEVSGGETNQNQPINATPESSEAETDNKAENQNSKTPLGFHSKFGEWETNTGATKNGSGEQKDVAGKNKKTVGARHYYKRADGSVGVIYHNISQGKFNATVNGKSSAFDTLEEAEQFLKETPEKEAVAPVNPEPEVKGETEVKPKPEVKSEPEVNKGVILSEKDLPKEINGKELVVSITPKGHSYTYGDVNIYPNGDGTYVLLEEDTGFPIDENEESYSLGKAVEETIELLEGKKAPNVSEVDESNNEASIGKQDEGSSGGLELNLETEDDEIEEKPEPKPQKKTISDKQKKIVEKLGKLAEKCGVKVYVGNEQVLEQLKQEFPNATFEEQEDGTIKVNDNNGYEDIFEGGSDFSNNAIYITDNAIKVNTTVHEFTHLWNKIVQKNNPVLWSKIVNVLKQTSKWNEVGELYKNEIAAQPEAQRENYQADEVMAWLAGENANKRFKELRNEGTPAQIVNKLKSALKAYWNKVKELFHEKLGVELDDVTEEEIVNMPLADLLEGRVNIAEQTHKENQHVDSVINKTDDNFDKNTGKKSLGKIINSLSKDVKPVFQKAFDEVNIKLNLMINEMDHIDDFELNIGASILSDDINEALKGKPFSEMPNARLAFHYHFDNELAKAYEKKEAAAEKAKKEAEKAAKKKEAEEAKANKDAAKEAGESEEFSKYKQKNNLSKEEVEFFKLDSGITGVNDIKDNLPLYAVIEKLANAENSEYSKGYYTPLLDKLSGIINEPSEEYKALNKYFKSLTSGEELPLSGEQYLDFNEEQKLVTIKQLKDVNAFVSDSLDNVANDNTDETIANEREFIADAYFVKNNEALNKKLIDYALKKFDEGIREFATKKLPPPQNTKAKTSFGNGTLLAPNGKPSNLSPEMYKMVRTPEFKAWFGDWENDPEHASKVVDENGEPLVVFHGEDLYDDQKKEVFGEHSGKVFTTENWDMAATYSSYKKHLLREGETGRGVYALFVNIKNPYIVDAQMSVWNDLNDKFGHKTDIIALKAKKEGYDGTIVKNVFDQLSGNHSSDAVSGTDYISYEPTQLKSALNNNGNFNPNDKNIYHSVSVDEVATRAYQAVLKEIQEAFPNAKFTNEGANIVATLPNGAKIRISIKDNIILNEKQRNRAFKDHNVSNGVIQGFWKKFSLDGCKRMLAVSRNSEIGTAFHEALHAAIDMALTEKEKHALYRYYTEQAKLEGRDVEEVVADAYRDWVLGRKAEGKTTFGKLWQKVKDFARRMQAFFTNNEKAGIEKIFQDVESGKVYEREAEGKDKGKNSFNIKSARTELKKDIAKWSQTVDSFLNGTIDASSPAYVMQTPLVMQYVGAKDLPIKIDVSIMSKVLRNKHGAQVTPDVLKQLPGALANPMFIYKTKSKDGKNDVMASVLSLRDSNKDFILVPVILEVSEDGVTYNISKIESAYGKESLRKSGGTFVEKVLKGNTNNPYENLLYIDKKRIDMYSKSSGLQLPTGLDYNNNSFPSSIATNEEIVNLKEQYPTKYSVSPSSSATLEQRAKVTRSSQGESFTSKIENIKKEPIKYITEKLKELFRKLYRDWIDKNYNFELLDKETAKRIKRHLAEAEKVYNKMHGINYKSAGMAEGLLLGGEYEFDAMNMRLTKVKMKYKNGTMATVMDNIDEEHLDPKSKAFINKYGFKDSVEALGEALTWKQLKELYRFYHEEHKAWEDGGRKGEEPVMRKIPNNLSEQELDQLISEIPSQFNKACQDYYDMNDNILSILEDAGVISHSLHEVLNKHKNYCPLQRDFSDTAGLDSYLQGFNAGGSGAANVTNSIIKHMTKGGSDRVVINPLETTVSVIHMATRRAERNKAALHFVSLGKLKDSNGNLVMEDVVQPRWHWAKTEAEKKQGEKIVDANGKVLGFMVKDTARMEDSTFSVMEDGVKKTYWCNPIYYEDLVGGNPEVNGMIWDFMSGFAKVLRFMATKSPSFIIRNGIRDTLTAAINSGDIGYTPFKGSIDALKLLHKAEKNRTVEERKLIGMFRVSGISTSNRASDGQAIYKSLRDMVKSKDLKFDDPVATAKALWAYYDGENEKIEQAPRLKIFELKLEYNMKKVKNRELTDKEKNDGYFATELDAVDDAIREALRDTTDFGRLGVKGQKVNQVVPFFNATLQGIDIMVNQLVNPKTRNQTIYNIGKYLVIPSMVLWMMNHDKDWYKESDRQMRYSNWFISDKLRVPVPQDFGVLFHGLTTALLDRINDHDPKALPELGLSVRGTVFPNIIPTAIAPILEWQANYSFFTHKPIVSQRLQKMPDELQYDTGTPDVIRGLGKATGTSPKKIQALVRGYLATLGDYGVRALDIPYGLIFGSEGDGAAKKFNEQIGIRDFNVTESIRTRYSNDFYDMLTEMQKQHQGYGKKGHPSKDLQAVNAANRVAGKLMREIRAIEVDNRYTKEQRRELIDKKREKMNAVFRKAVEKYGSKYL